MGRLRSIRNSNIKKAPITTRVDNTSLPYLSGFAFKIYEKDLMYVPKNAKIGKDGKPIKKGFTITSIRFVADGVHTLARELIKRYKIQLNKIKKKPTDGGEKPTVDGPVEILDTDAGFLYSLIKKDTNGRYMIRVPYYNTASSTRLTLTQQDQADKIAEVGSYYLKDGGCYAISIKSKNPFFDRAMYVEFQNIRAESSKSNGRYFLQAKSVEPKPIPRILKSLSHFTSKEATISMRKYVIEQLKSGFYLEKDGNTNMFQLMNQVAVIDSEKRDYSLKELFRAPDIRYVDNYTVYIKGKDQDYVPMRTYAHILNYNKGIKESDLVRNDRYIVPSVETMVDRYNNGMKDSDYEPQNNSMLINNFIFLMKGGPKDLNDPDKLLVNPDTVSQRISFTLSIERDDKVYEFKGNIFEDDTQGFYGISDKLLYESISAINRLDMIISFYIDEDSAKKTSWYQKNEYRIKSTVFDENEGFGDESMDESQQSQKETSENTGADVKLPIKISTAFPNFGPYLMEYGLMPCSNGDSVFMAELCGLMMDLRNLTMMRDGEGSPHEIEYYFGVDTNKEKLQSFCVSFSDHIKEVEDYNDEESNEKKKKVSLTNFLKTYDVEVRYDKGLKKELLNRFNNSGNSIIKNLSELHGTFDMYKKQTNDYRVLIGIENIHNIHNMKNRIDSKLKSEDLDFYRILALNHKLTSGEISNGDKPAICFHIRKFLRRIIYSVFKRIESNGKNLPTSCNQVQNTAMEVLETLQDLDYKNTLKLITKEQAKKFDVKKYKLSKEKEYVILSSFRFVPYVIEGVIRVPSENKRKRVPESESDKTTEEKRIVTIPVTERKKKNKDKSKKKKKKTNKE